jgi:hypothetical protein
MIISDGIHNKIKKKAHMEGNKNILSSIIDFRIHTILKHIERGTYRTCSKINHNIGHKTSLSKFKNRNHTKYYF